MLARGRGSDVFSLYCFDILRLLYIGSYLPFIKFYQGFKEMTQDPTRAAFEERYNTKSKMATYRLERYCDEYVDSRACIAWEVWQAATKHQSDKCAGLEVAVKDVIDYCRPQNQQRDFVAVVNTLHKALKEHRDSVEGG